MLFRGKFLGLLKNAYVSGKIDFDSVAFNNVVTCAYRKKWNVYLESPFENPLRVVKYLAAYSNRVAISDNRILSVQNGMVRFKYLNRNHKGGAQWDTECIDTATFIRRFVDHILPRGLVKIRSYGILSNRVIQSILPVCTAFIQKQQPLSNGIYSAMREVTLLLYDGLFPRLRNKCLMLLAEILP